MNVRHGSMRPLAPPPRQPQQRHDNDHQNEPTDHPHQHHQLTLLSTWYHQRTSPPPQQLTTTINQRTRNQQLLLTAPPPPQAPLAPLRRVVSKNCANLRKYGSARLHGHRRQRQSDRSTKYEIEQIRESLQAMDRHLSLLDSVVLSMRQNAESAAMKLVETYFRHLQNGFCDDLNARENVKPFLETAFDQDLKCADFTGIANFYEQWQNVTKYHAHLQMENEFLMALPGDGNCDPINGNDVYVVKTTGKTTCKISRDTIVYFFPHILQDEPLVQWLIGKWYAYSYTMIFHINSNGQVFQFESKIDLTSGLITLLSDPFATLKLIESSMWTKCGNLKSGVHENEFEIENGILM